MACGNFGWAGDGSVLFQPQVDVAAAACAFHYPSAQHTCVGDHPFGIGERICRSGNVNHQLRICQYTDASWNFPRDHAIGNCPEHKLEECPAAGTSAGSWSMDPSQVSTFAGSCLGECEINMIKFYVYDDGSNNPSFDPDSYPDEWGVDSNIGNTGVGEFVYTGENCETESVPEGESDIDTGSSGLNVTDPFDGSDCFNIDGETVCPSQDTCEDDSAGNRACGGGASVPDVPDNGTDPDVPAAPDLTVINNSSSNTTNFFDESTVAQSTTSDSGGGSDETNSDGEGGDGEILAELREIESELQRIRESQDAPETEQAPSPGNFEVEFTQQQADEAIKGTLGIDDQPSYDERESQMHAAVSNLINTDGSSGECSVSGSVPQLGEVEMSLCEYQTTLSFMGNVLYFIAIVGSWIAVTRS